MHVVFLTHEYPKAGLNSGGVGSFVKFLAEALVSNNVIVSIVGINNTYKDEKSVVNGVTIYRIKKSKWRIAKFFQNSIRIRRLLKKINNQTSIDILEGSELSFAFLPKKANYKKVIRMHGGHHFFALELNSKTAFWRSYQEKKSFSKANAFIAVSNYVGNQTKKYLGLNFEFKTIYNSVNTENFKPSKGVNVKKDSILFVGTICEKKGVKDLVLAMKLVVKDFPNVELKIVGRDWFFKNGDSYIQYLQKFITDDIKDCINIIGPVPHHDIPNLIDESEICVYPSHMEAMPIAWLEGLAKGKPVVGTSIGPGKEAIINNKTGLLAKPNSEIDLANQIKYLLKNKDEAIKIGKQAREDVLTRFNSKTIVNSNIDFYKSIM